MSRTHWHLYIYIAITAPGLNLYKNAKKYQNTQAAHPVMLIAVHLMFGSPSRKICINKLQKNNPQRLYAPKCRLLSDD